MERYAQWIVEVFTDWIMSSVPDKSSTSSKYLRGLLCARMETKRDQWRNYFGMKNLEMTNLMNAKQAKEFKEYSRGKTNIPWKNDIRRIDKEKRAIQLREQEEKRLVKRARCSAKKAA